MRSTRSYADGLPARALAAAGLLIALGSVLGLLENAVMPPLPVPGVRLGLANIAVVLALGILGRRGALLVSLGRVAVVGILSGSLGGPAALLAVAGAMASWAVMAALSAGRERFSVIGWSVGGAAAHVAGQLVAAGLVTGSPAVFAFAPVSLVLALACGLAVGYSSRLLFSRLPVALRLEAAG
jgi:heptaprenyl diphosphate synthase